MRVQVRGGALWFDVSGPSLALAGEASSERPTLVTVHGGPGLDHTGMRGTLAPLADSAQLLFYDQRGHGRSDYGTSADWNLQSWATDLRDLCDALGLVAPIVLGSSFGGFVVATYAAMFPDHPAGVVLSNTTGGRTDHARSIEVFRRIGGDQAAAAARRDFEEITEESAEEFNRVCHPLFSARPGYVEEAHRRIALSIHTTEVNLHYWRNESERTDPWALLPEIRCPVLVIGGEDDPICPIEVVQDLVQGLTSAAEVELLRLPGARHAVFRDAPDLAFPAVLRFIRQHTREAQADAN